MLFNKTPSAFWPWVSWMQVQPYYEIFGCVVWKSIIIKSELIQPLFFDGDPYWLVVIPIMLMFFYCFPRLFYGDGDVGYIIGCARRPRVGGLGLNPL